MRPSTFRRTAAAALVAAVALGSPALAHPGKGRGPRPRPAKLRSGTAGTAGAADVSRCVGNSQDVQRLDLTVAGTPTWGLFAMPDHPAKGIVVFAHGYGHTAESWRRHIAATAARDDVVAVAMDYRFQHDTPGSPLPTSRGWRVAEGAEDSIAAAQYFNALCPRARTIVMYGVSMGGNTAGLAVAAQAKRGNGSPLFDYWFNIEGANNVTETYNEARGLAVSGNSTAVNAVADVEEEMDGKTFEEAPELYLERSTVTRAEDIEASGIRGVVMVQGVDDGLVGSNQQPEMYTRLRALGVPVDVWTAVTRGEGSEPGTTLDGYVTGQVPGFESPFAGHASEASETHIVGNTGFERLAALFLDGEAPACRVGVLDGTLGHDEYDPLTTRPTC
jgi:acetyl esterase/lipase